MNIRCVFALVFFLFMSKTMCINLSQIKNHTVIVDKSPIEAPKIKYATFNDSNILGVFWQARSFNNINIRYCNIYKVSDSGYSELITQISDLKISSYFEKLTCPFNYSMFKVSYVDACGVEKFSEAHSPIYLKSNSSNDTVTLSWTSYVGHSVNKYEIYKKIENDDFILLDSVDKTTLSYVDKSEVDQRTYYKIKAIYIDSIYETSFSNTAESTVNQSKNTNFSSEDELRIYPLPLVISSIVEFPCDTMQKYIISIIDVYGRIVLKKNVFFNKFTLNRNNLPSGNYILQVKSKNNIWNKVFIIK